MILLQSYLDVEQRQCSLEKDMKTFEKETALSCSSAEELEKEELEVIKFCQRRSFPEEFSRLQKGKGVKGTKPTDRGWCTKSWWLAQQIMYACRS